MTDTRTPEQKASDELMDRMHRESGLVPVKDQDGATWWVKPESADRIRLHSLAAMRALFNRFPEA